MANINVWHHVFVLVSPGSRISNKTISCARCSRPGSVSSSISCVEVLKSVLVRLAMSSTIRKIIVSRTLILDYLCAVSYTPYAMAKIWQLFCSNKTNLCGPELPKPTLKTVYIVFGFISSSSGSTKTPCQNHVSRSHFCVLKVHFGAFICF